MFKENAEIERKLEAEYLAFLEQESNQWIRFDSYMMTSFKKLIDDSDRHAKIFERIAQDLEKE